MITLPAQANVLEMPAVARAGGDPITAGTVNFYLVAKDGTNAGKWFRGSDTSWQAAEAIAGAAAHRADGHWYKSITAAAWIDGVSYTAYLKESGDLHVPLSLPILCQSGTGATAEEVKAQVLDAIDVDGLVAGVPVTEALRRIGAMAGGVVTGARTGIETYYDYAGSIHTVVVTVDVQGNRPLVTYN